MRRAGSAIGLALRELLPGEASPNAAKRLREKKLRALLRHASKHVPFYRERFRAAGIAASDLDDPAILGRLPSTTKDQFREARDTLLSEKYPPAELETELTSGSSGQPFATRFDREYVIARNARFLRGLFSAGYRPGDRLMLIAERTPSRASTLTRWLYCPLDAPPAEQAQHLRTFAPQFLYGALTALRMLADELERAPPGSFHPPRRVITTAEMLDPGTRSRLEQVFAAPVLDFYGMTEMGLVAWQRRPEGPYAIADESVIVERLPVPGLPGASRLVLTNLDLWAMPIIRFDSGDIGIFDGETDSLLRVEGRSVDCIAGLDGRRVSPYELTTVLQEITALGRFRIRQVAATALEVELQTQPATGERVSSEAVRRLTEVLGTGFEIRPRVVADFPPGLSGKFRVVESLIGS